MTTFASACPVSLCRKPLSPGIEATPKTDLSLSRSLVHRQTWRLTDNIRNVTAGKFVGSVLQSALNAGILAFCSRKYCTSSGGTSREWWLCSNETFYSESRLYEELLETCRKLRCK